MITSPWSDRDFLVLGIESSCDDTAAAVIRRRPDGGCDVLSNVIASQTDAHAPYGGVVPEIAARSHVEHIDGVIAEAVEKSGHTYADLAAIGATAGPGLVGGVMVGLTTAKAIALGHDVPLIPVNHLEGHALSARMTEKVEFPYLLLLVSGGHTQLIRVDGVGRYRRLGTTIDDAAGESFDKAAKLLGLPQPGGPSIERAASVGRSDRFRLPAPLAGREGADFSLSGLKTAIRLAAESVDHPTSADIADLAASFEAAVTRHLAARTERAMALMEDEIGGGLSLVAAGGVAANKRLRAELQSLAQSRGWRMVVPPAKFCTDNGAMIAFAAAERLALGLAPEADDALGFPPRARWPLADPIAGREHGGGRKGPKA